MGENELDLELVKRVQRGDKTAFDLLVRKYQHRIGAVIGRFIHDYSESQDVAQESFIRAYRAIGNFRGACPRVSYALDAVFGWDVST